MEEDLKLLVNISTCKNSFNSSLSELAGYASLALPELGTAQPSLLSNILIQLSVFILIIISG